MTAALINWLGTKLKTVSTGAWLNVALIAGAALLLTVTALSIKHKFERPAAPPPVVVERHPQAPVEVDPAPVKAKPTPVKAKPAPDAKRPSLRKKPVPRKAHKAPKAPKASTATRRECDASGWCWTYFNA